MAKRFLSIVLCMMLVAPASILRADETEIPLIETLTIGYLGGDEPLDDPGHTGMEPPIMRFRATHSLNTLSIISLEAVGTATVAVLDYHGEIVFYQNMFFPSANTIRQILTDTWYSGEYTLYISTLGHNYQGSFEIE